MTKGSRGSNSSASSQHHQQQNQGNGAGNGAKQSSSDNKSEEAAEDRDGLTDNNVDNTGGDDEDADKEENNSDGDDEDDEDEDDDDDEEEDDEDEDDGVVRCVCGERNDGELMIQCEICQVWQHTLCMGIRDESHIPDKYYCEKCRPEDHPYINSRPRTVVLAEASIMGTSTMMRRSAVMAVAKMSAREEYRAASAAAAIAASVAAAATGISLPNGNGGGGGKKTPRKQSRKNDAVTPKPGRNGRRSRRSTRGGSGGTDNDGAEISDDEYTFASRNNNNNESGTGSSAVSNGDGRSDPAKPAQSGTRKQQTLKRSTASATTTAPAAVASAGQANGLHKRRRVTMPGNMPRGATASMTNFLNVDGRDEEDQQDGSEDDNDDDDDDDEEDEEDEEDGEERAASGNFAQDLASRMLKVNQERKKRGKNSRMPQSTRVRSVSSAVKESARQDSDAFDVAESLRSPRRRAAGNSKSIGDFKMSDTRRGHSEPGSPQRRSSSPSLHSLLYGDDSNSKNDNKPNKRKRGGAAARVGRQQQQRMTVSATNSPFIGDNNGFATFAERNRAASAAGIFAAGKNADDSNDDQSNQSKNDNDQSADEKSDSQDAHRRPKHDFPPQEMVDVDGNTIVVPSHMLNSQGQPIYSSVTAETMCKIRYPHSKASLYDLSRRAKQLLEWLGKTQSEYEHERLTWLSPLRRKERTEEHDADADADADVVESACDGALGFEDGAPLARKSSTSQVSEAPTSPISPSDWPTDEVAVNGGADEELDAEPKPSHPRSTQSLMEDLVWRLIRFQEAYSN
ncbi:Histone deacetylase complex subunit [Coemansia asiatica]|nr:Histone deacetylase complex subunit [Coemansia asiatica]